MNFKKFFLLFPTVIPIVEKHFAPKQRSDPFWYIVNFALCHKFNLSLVLFFKALNLIPIFINDYSVRVRLRLENEYKFKKMMNFYEKLAQNVENTKMASINHSQLATVATSLIKDYLDDCFIVQDTTKETSVSRLYSLIKKIDALCNAIIINILKIVDSRLTNLQHTQILDLFKVMIKLILYEIIASFLFNIKKDAMNFTSEKFTNIFSSRINQIAHILESSMFDSMSPNVRLDVFYQLLNSPNNTLASDVRSQLILKLPKDIEYFYNQGLSPLLDSIYKLLASLLSETALDNKLITIQYIISIWLAFQKLDETGKLYITQQKLIDKKLEHQKLIGDLFKNIVSIKLSPDEQQNEVSSYNKSKQLLNTLEKENKESKQLALKEIIEPNSKIIYIVGVGLYLISALLTDESALLKENLKLFLSVICSFVKAIMSNLVEDHPILILTGNFIQNNISVLKTFYDNSDSSYIEIIKPILFFIFMHAQMTCCIDLAESNVKDLLSAYSSYLVFKNQTQAVLQQLCNSEERPFITENLSQGNLLIKLEEPFYYEKIN